MRRGDVYWVNLDPVIGAEVGRRRPAVVVQNEAANRSSSTVTVIPLTSSIDRVYPFQALVAAGEGGLSRQSKALCEQVRTLSRNRLTDRLGRLPNERMDQIREALDRHLWV